MSLLLEYFPGLREPAFERIAIPEVATKELQNFDQELKLLDTKSKNQILWTPKIF